jgi:hypothetical protein
MNLSAEFLKIVLCPVSGRKLEYDEGKKVLISKEANLEYPVVNGIPLLLESEAKKI